MRDHYRNKASVKCLAYILRETNALYGLGLAVTPSVKSADGRGSPGTTEKLNACSSVAVMIKMLLLANISPMQRCLPVRYKSFGLRIEFVLRFDYKFYSYTQEI